jgi:voltage-gated potassium channel
MKHAATSSNLKYFRKLHGVIFEADTKAGKLFDVFLILFILASVLVVMLDSVASINARYGEYLYLLEWFFTIIFSIEYILRILAVYKPHKYAFSFYGIVDFLAIVPTYFSLLFPGSQYLLMIRLLRALRIFRVLKLVQYLSEAKHLSQAIKASRRKISIFLLTVFTAASILGSLMYLIEGSENGFTNIPKSIYWAIVTLTTVGYGDISPQTPLGQAVASIIMILGYSIIAVPTGIITMEMGRTQEAVNMQSCHSCGAEGHDVDAVYCKYCGKKINE